MSPGACDRRFLASLPLFTLIPVLLLSIHHAAAQPATSQQCMHTVAGTGSAGFRGDAASATVAQLNTPTGVATYRDGVLVADYFNSAIRFVNATSGMMTTVAGRIGSSSYSGDGAAATFASLTFPYGIAVYAGGFLIADRGNSAIRFVNGSTNFISTIAGRGSSSPGDNGPATSAALSNPSAVVVNGSDFYIADTDNYRIRRVDSNRTIVTIAGNGTLGYSGDGAAAVSAMIGRVYGMAVYSGGLLIADFDSNRIRRISSDGMISTVAGGGSGTGAGAATSMSLNRPTGVTSNGVSSFTIADWGNHLIRLVNDTGYMTTIAGSGTPGYSGDGGLATAANLNNPWGVALDGYGGVIIGGNSNHAIRYVTPPGMCRPLVNCSVIDPNLICTFSPVAPYLYLNVTLSGAACTLLQAAPATTRNVTCPLPSAATGNLTWTVGNIGSSMTIQIVTPTSTATSSATRSSSQTSTSSSTGSGTSSSSMAPTGSSSSSASRTSTNTASGTGSSSLSSSSSGTTTSSSTSNASGSLSSSMTTSASMSSSSSMTLTGSRTETAWQSSSSSSTWLPPASGTSSSTSTAASTGSASSTPSDMSTSTRSNSMTSSSSPVLTSTSPTPSATSTAAPPGAPLLSLFLSTSLTPLSSSTPPLQLRDVDAPLSLTARVSTCTTVSSCTLTCSTSSSDVLRVSPTSTPISDTIDATISIWARYGALSAPSTVLLTCSVQHITDTSSSSRLSITVRVTPIPLPLITDVMLHIPRQPLVRSVWTSALCNITAAATSNISSIPVLPSSLLFSARSPLQQTMDAAMLASCARTSLAPSSEYRLTCNGGSNITLVAGTGTGSAAFNASTNSVRIGSQPVSASRISSDGALMHIQLPSSLALCGSYECGYVPLTISAGVVSLSCPGFCAASNRTVPQCDVTCAAADVRDGTTPPSRMSSSASSGLFITSNCDAAVYTDPSTGACANASDPASARCAFGAGDACSPCPSNALCPGGFRAWPLPGYFTPSEASGAVTLCPPPATRCIGWNAEQSIVACAPAYRYGSYMCSTCAAGFYAGIDGSCVVCPSTPSPIMSLIPFAMFVGYILAALLGLYLLMLGIALMVKSRTDDIHSRVGSLAAWSFTTVQLIAQAGRTAASGLPSTLLAMYTALAVSQFSGITLPSSCVSGYPFSSEVASMSIGLAALLCAACLATYTRRGAFTHAHAAALRVCVMLLTLVYATLVNAALSLVSCTSIRITVSAYLGLDGDGSTLDRAGVSLSSSASSSTLLDVLVQASNPSRVCYEGSHTAAAALAWLALIVVGVMYPAACMWCVYLRVRADVAAEARDTQHKPSLRRGRTHAWGYDNESNTDAAGGVEQRARLQRPVTVSHAPVAVDAGNGERGSEATSIIRPVVTQRHNRVAASLQAPAFDAMLQKLSELPVGIPHWQLVAAPTSTAGLQAFHLVGVDDSVRVLHDALLTPFVQADYRPSAFAFYAVDRYVILCMSVVAATLRSTTDSTIIAARASLLLLVLLTNAALILRLSPFYPCEWWKGAVKLLTIGLTCAIIALNAMTSILTLRASSAGVSLSPTISSAITGGAYIVFALCVCVLAALPLTFMLNAIHPPPRVVVQTDADALRADESTAAAVTLQVNPLAGNSQTSAAARRIMMREARVAQSRRRASAASSRVHSAQPTHLQSHIGRAEALSFAVSPSARPLSSRSRVKRVSRMSIVLQAGAAVSSEADADPGSGRRRSSSRGSHHRLGRFSVINSSTLTAPALTSFAHAATRRHSGLVGWAAFRSRHGRGAQ